MGFVNREERNGNALQPFDGVGAGETFGGKIEQAVMCFDGLG